MKTKLLIDAMKRVETWPQAAQEELAGMALEIDTALKGEVYYATPEELAGIDRGLRICSTPGRGILRRIGLKST